MNNELFCRVFLAHLSQMPSFHSVLKDTTESLSLEHSLPPALAREAIPWLLRKRLLRWPHYRPDGSKRSVLSAVPEPSESQDC